MICFIQNPKLGGRLMDKQQQAPKRLGPLLKAISQNYLMPLLIASMKTSLDNMSFRHNPSLDEIKSDVFQLDPLSYTGRDGFTGHFYSSCWSII